MRSGKPETRNPKLETANARRLVPLLLDWFAANARDLPWRRTRDPYAIWVSEIMLQQTQVKTVIPYFDRWLRELPAIDGLANASSEKIHKLWEGLGYYTRVRNMQKAAQIIMQQHGGKFPRTYDNVLALPGIGRYTAGSICSIAFNAPTPILDGNVVRVLTRVFGIREHAREKETNARLWLIAEELVTHSADRSKSARSRYLACSAFNQSLMELGAMVCTPRAPSCCDCPLSKHCFARRENVIEELPNLGERVTVTARRFAAAVVERRDRALIRQRPEGVVNAHLWEFPNVEISIGASPRQVRAAVEKELGCAAKKLTLLGTIRHTITRYRIALDVFRVELNGTLPAKDCGVWKSAGELDSLAFTSAHARIARQWLGQGR